MLPTKCIKLKLKNKFTLLKIRKHVTFLYLVTNGEKKIHAKYFIFRNKISGESE